MVEKSSDGLLKVRRQERGSFMVELMVAMAVLGIALIPMAFSFAQEQQLCRTYYYRAVAMEIVDGELEILATGEWRQFRKGSRPYRVHAESAQNLPPGRFVLTINSQRVRLEWIPNKKNQGGGVSREIQLP